jgi:hypothetical protein
MPATLRILLACLMLVWAGAVEQVSISFKTSAAGGQYANSNGVAVWVMNSGGAYTRTVARWVGSSTNVKANSAWQGLTWWRNKAGTNGDVDGFMGATRGNHTATLSINWDCSVKGGVAGSAPDGVYTIWFEVADANNPTASGSNVTGANRFSFTVNKNGTASSGAPTDGTGKFTAVTWTYTGRPVTPTVTAVAPASGPVAGGTAVTITGTNLTGASGVTFGGTAATSVSAVSATQVTCVTPVHAAGAVTIVVTASAGTGTGTNLFTYLAAPSITTLSPTTGTTAGGTTVTITGTGLTGTTGVTFGGTAATSVNVVSATQVTCVAPAHAAGAVNVVVTTPGGTATSTGGFTYAVPVPGITTISPNNGSTLGGTAITITGTNLTGATGVTFGGTAATAVNVVSATQVTCVAPAHAAGAVNVVVTTPGGTATSTAGYSYQAPGAPTISTVSPASGLVAGGTTVTIGGTNLTGTSSITFGGTAATSVNVISATQVTCVTPAHAVGAVDVVLTATGGTITSVGSFTYLPPAPGLTSIAPVTGSTLGGTSVTITGTNLTGATSVTFGGTAATAVNVVSSTQVTCTTPAHAAGAVTVALTTAGGTASSPAAFTYAVPAASFTSISPATGSTLGGTSVTITGTSLTGATSVTFGGTAATAVNVVSATQVTCTTPAHAAGAVDVVVATPGGNATGAGAFTYLAPVPSVSAAMPTFGSTVGGLTITITGTNLTGTTAVTIGGTPATGITVLSSTQVACVVPAHAAGLVNIMVTTPGGTATGTGIFTYAAPPGFTTQPADQTASEGSTATFSVVVNGTGPFTYQWRRDSTAITGANAASYTTATLTLADSGAVFTCEVSNDVDTQVSNGATLTVVPLPPAISSPLAATAQVGASFSYQITASHAPTSYGATGLPTGLAVSSTGLITGTPTVAGSSTVTLSAGNAGGTGTASLAITVLAVGSPVPLVTSPATATATVGSPFSFQATATGTPTTWSATGLPAWLSMDAAGLLTGTPTATGTVSIGIDAANGSGTGHGSLAITVSPASAGNSVLITFTTTAAGGSYAPKNIVAVWIETSGGSFVRTVGDWSDTRRSSLTTWLGRAGTGDADGVMGATRLSHGTLTAAWDMLDRSGSVVADGSYVVWIETVDENAGANKNVARVDITLTGGVATMGAAPAATGTDYPSSGHCGYGSANALILMVLAMLLAAALRRLRQA